MGTENLVDQIGRLFIVGYPGAEPPPAFLEFVSEHQLGGVILFGDNCASPDIVRSAIEKINAQYADTRPFIAIDQEGGPVMRLQGGMAQLGSAMDYAETGRLDAFSDAYARMAVHMESLGINLNFAPVADIFLDETNTCLESRCYGRDAETVSRFVTRSVEVARQHGILSCLKHFPGLGAAKNDPHKRTAVADYTLDQWHGRERLPFYAGIKAGADMIMTTHMAVPAIDDTIATGSRKMIGDMIRLMLSFDGPVITDELMMEGAGVLGGLAKRTVAAFTAGHDLLLFGQDYEKAIFAFDYFAEAVQRGEIETKRLESAIDRVSGLKYKLTSVTG